VTAKINAFILIQKTRSANYPEWEAKASNLLGVIYFQNGNFDSSLVFYNKALSLAEKFNYTDQRGNIIGNIGLVYSRMGDFNKAIEMLFKSLEFCESQNDSIGMAKKLADIGNTYQYLNKCENSIDYLKQALDIFLIYNDSTGQANVLNSLGSAFQEVKDYKNASSYYNHSLEIKLKLNDKKGALNSYINIANLSADEGNYQYALDCFFHALDLSTQVDDKDNMAIIYNDIGAIYQKINEPDKALSCYLQSLEIASQINANVMVKKCAKNLSEIYEELGDYKKALEYNKLYYQTRIQMSDETINAKINEIEAKYQTEKKDKELIIKDAEIIKQQADASKKAIQRNALLTGFFVILIFSVLLFRLFLQKKKANKLLAAQNAEILQQKEEIIAQRDEIEAQRNEIESQRDLVTEQKEHIEEIHKEVTDSIRYAKRIQEAVLPVSTSARSVLGEHFILFLPRNIVSGDFYWTTRVNNFLIVAVADCTGHGVPGAFMSMLGISFLNEIVRKQEVTQANHVLNELRNEIINALQQKKSTAENSHSDQSGVKDGMDISLLVINTDTYECQWSGANNPLYIVKNSQSGSGQQFIEIKGDKMPISIYEHMEAFKNHYFRAEKGDCMYLFSDGFADQFGGLDNKKFLYKQFKNILSENSMKTMTEQKEILEKAFRDWQGEKEQVDDITVLGIKLT
jgi:serine phosphatase RsbU (regulator of sigma subunit)/Flp pilus assembly protein TadD